MNTAMNGRGQNGNARGNGNGFQNNMNNGRGQRRGQNHVRFQNREVDNAEQNEVVPEVFGQDQGNWAHGY